MILDTDFIIDLMEELPEAVAQNSVAPFVSRYRYATGWKGRLPPHYLCAG